MSQTTEIKVVGKRGKKTGTKDIITVTLEELKRKFSDEKQPIPVNRKFAELLGLAGVIVDKPSYETILSPEKIEKIEFKVQELAD